MGICNSRRSRPAVTENSASTTTPHPWARSRAGSEASSSTLPSPQTIPAVPDGRGLAPRGPNGVPVRGRHNCPPADERLHLIFGRHDRGRHKHLCHFSACAHDHVLPPRSGRGSSQNKVRCVISCPLMTCVPEVGVAAFSNSPRKRMAQDLMYRHSERRAPGPSTSMTATDRRASTNAGSIFGQPDPEARARVASL